MLQVYNTLSRSKESFAPIHPPHVGLYVCGPTVYDDPHLGHAKSYVSFDVIVRFLRHSGFKVRYVQNITDVGHLLGEGDEGEDRVLKKARLEKLEPVEIAQKYERHFFRDMDLLNNLRPDISCRATGHIPEMIEMIEKLLKQGKAYETNGDVYFDVSRFPAYGRLSGRKIDDLREGVRKESAEGKRHFADFALWKKADAQHLMQWPSPWGRGFPGWHLECSVMSTKYIGESLDIHGGGLDNQFPHHECEIAQSEAATGKPFVKYWLHNNMVTVDGQKMSKSLGNFVTLEELFKKFDPMTVRFFILQGHYRSPQDFSEPALDAAAKGLARLSDAYHSLAGIAGDQEAGEETGEPWAGFQKKFQAFMEDDFSTAGAVAILFDMARAAQSLTREQAGQAASALRLFDMLAGDVLGLRFTPPQSSGESEKQVVDYLVELRNRFRAEKNWKLADEVRQRLESAGIVLEDGKDGTKWSRK
ncbi:cysteine--tRNA ligase [bacterium]|nr:cysteine--tRNA ligase [bacterium]